jgi:23S rRNA (guanine745-N1)-methyltransferase
VARQGYVNLAPGARQSEYYSRESFEHRGQILSAGYYSHIVDAVLSAVGRYCGQIAASIDFAGLRTRSGAQLRGARGRADLRSSGPQMRAPVILDVGCGEGFYARAVQAAHPDATVLAFDISKDSVQLAAREDAGCAVRWFVGIWPNYRCVTAPWTACSTCSRRSTTRNSRACSAARAW